MFKSLVKIFPGLLFLIVLALATSNLEQDDDLIDTLPANNHPPEQVVKLIEPEVKNEEQILRIDKSDSRVTKISNIDNVNGSTRFIYSWREASGIRVISTEKPQGQDEVKIYAYTNNTTSKSNTTGKEIITDNAIPNPTLILENPLNVYTPEGLRELIDYSHSIGEQIELRGQLMEELVEQL